jgi:nucleotide-binding universal stress UspA family protein
MLSIRSILMTTDLSPFSMSALEYASTLRFAFGARLSILHIVEKSRHPVAGDDEIRLEMQEMIASTGVPSDGVPCIVRHGIPALEIRRYAVETGTDLIVMATHGATGFRHRILGGVAEKVVRLSGVPVLTVKPGGAALELDERDIENDLHIR